MVDRDSAPRRLVVVSNDREIQKAARRRRAKVMSCEQLISLLTRPTTGSGETLDKPTGALGAAEIEMWLAEFDVDGDEPIDPPRDWRQ